MDRFGADHTHHFRRVPQQSRSRDRVERILDAAAAQVVESGVERLGTRGIAEAAGVPVASLYQYFADKDDILLALVERDLGEMDAAVMASIGELPRLSVATLAETTIRAFAEAYRERPAFITIWLRGRTNRTIRDYCREHNQRIAKDLFGIAQGSGLLTEEASALVVEVAIEVSDRLFEMAFAADLEGDAAVLAEAETAVVGYLERYATDLGLEGVPA